MKKSKRLPLLRIDHTKIIDGFAELAKHVNYQPFETFCGICDTSILVTPLVQKHLLENKRVPVKMLRRGGIYCDECAARRANINHLKKGNRYLEIENGKEQLNALEQAEKKLRNQSKNAYHNVKWPY